jgi:hypothetical protein
MNTDQPPLAALFASLTFEQRAELLERLVPVAELAQALRFDAPPTPPPPPRWGNFGPPPPLPDKGGAR